MTYLPLALRVLLAVVLFGRLAGVGRDVLPPPPILGVVLIAWLAIEALHGAGRPGWRGRAVMDPFAVALVLLTLAAVLVRLPSIDADFGRQPLDIDGRRLGASIRHFFVTGTIEYRTVEHYPGIVYWVMTGASLVFYLWGLMTRAISNVREMPVEHFMLAARITNVGFAGATVALTGLLGRRLGGAGAGLAAAALLAFAPLAVETTTETRNDAGQVLLLVACAWCALTAWDTKSGRWALAAGALAGLATAVKYTSVFALVPALVSVWPAGSGAARLRRAAGVIAAFAAALAITNHFLWWDFANFVRQLSDQVAITGRGHRMATDNPPAMQREVLARFGPGWPLLLLGAGWGAWGLASGRPRAWLFWSFPLIYSWFTTQRPSQFPRWVYPLLPFMAAAGACGLMAIVHAVMRWRWARLSHPRAAATAAASLVVAAALGPPLAAGAVTISRRLTPSTAMVLEDWLHATIPASHVVLLEDDWLDLRDAPFHVLRVKDLNWALSPDRLAMSAADLIVVPEPYFSHADLGQLALVKEVKADRSFGGNLGHDYRVYTAPRRAPADAVDVRLSDPGAAVMLGEEWTRRHARGWRLPSGGGTVFLPPPVREEVTLELDVAGSSGAGLLLRSPHGLIELTEADPPSPGVRRLAGRLRAPDTPRGFALRLEPARRGARIDVLAVRLH
ncbi:MAG TPA: glycosyltransferase family 39 protein [Vicinamibacterales bacterium]